MRPPRLPSVQHHAMLRELDNRIRRIVASTIAAELRELAGEMETVADERVLLDRALEVEGRK